jgi:hypothetical protein
VVEVQLLHYALTVRVHGLGADHQLLGDLVVRETFRRQLQDLALAVGEGVVVVAGLAALQVLAQELLDGGWVEEDVAISSTSAELLRT